MLRVQNPKNLCIENDWIIYSILFAVSLLLMKEIKCLSISLNSTSLSIMTASLKPTLLVRNINTNKVVGVRVTLLSVVCLFMMNLNVGTEEQYI